MEANLSRRWLLGVALMVSGATVLFTALPLDMVADIAIGYLILGALISSGITIMYPGNVKAKVFGYQFKSRVGAGIAMFLMILVAWPAAIILGEFE